MGFWEFMRKALSHKGEPSQTRLLAFSVGFMFAIAITVGFFWVLRWYPQYLLEYCLLMLGTVATLAGIKTTQSIFAPKENTKKVEEQKNENQSA